jgi:DNA-binding transcriptional LysR family regulator
MEFRDLELFVAVAEELHFSRAAARVGMAQPPFSQRIKALEAALGLKLLLRTSRQVELTPEGQALLVKARSLLSQRTQVGATLREMASGQRGQLSLAFSASSATPVLSHLLRAMRDLCPDISVRVQECELSEVGQRIRNGDIDAAIVRMPFLAAGVVVIPFLSEPLMIAMADDHPLAARPQLELPHVVGEPVILFYRHAAQGFYDSIVSLCAAAGFTPNVVQEAGSWLTVASLVSAGMGITFAPASAREFAPRNVVFRPLNPATARSALGLVHAQGSINNATARFVSVCTQMEDHEGGAGPRAFPDPE